MTAAVVTAKDSVSWHVTSARWRTALLTAVALVASLLGAMLVLQLEIASVAVLLVLALLLAIVWQPRLGLYVIFGLMLLFEPGGLDELMRPGGYLHNGLGASFNLSGVSVSPLELLLVLMLLVWLSHSVAVRQLRIRGGRLAWPMLLFALSLPAGYAWGTLNGGDTYLGFWELRPLLYLVISYFLAVNLVRTVAHVQTLTTVALVSASLFAIEGTYRRLALIDTGQLGTVMEFWYWHEDVIFLSTLVLLVLAQQVFGAPRWQRILGVFLLPVAVFTLLATERRSGSIALIMAFLVLALVLLVVHRRAFVLMVVPILLGGALYLPLFWNNTGTFGQPARAIRSLSDPD
ncbi:MAG TPA: hypothetical protein VGW38_10605, partial [Chloroflexota bacterium]|nr:hypothetical protein [Chloroflexota bacterium]